METSVEQFEKNVQASFGYVKKDLMNLNDTVSDIHEKIQHLSMNHATLLGEMEKLRGKSSVKKPVKKKTSKKRK